MDESSNGSNSTKSNQIADYELEDALVYRLASRMGGRSEVVDMPILDALTYLIIYFEELEHEYEVNQWQLYSDHISRMMSNPAQDQEQQKQQLEFAESLKPKPKYTGPKQTDYAKLDQLIAAQEQAYKQLN